MSIKKQKPLNEKQIASLQKLLDVGRCVGGGGKGKRDILWAHADALVDRGLAEPAGLVTTQITLSAKGNLATQKQSFRITDAGRALLEAAQ